jgi:hypothetical protein
VPGTRLWLLGVANVRDNLVPLIDLKQYLEGERALLTESSRVAGTAVRRQRRPARGRSTRQRNFSEEQRADAIGEGRSLPVRFVGEKYLWAGSIGACSAWRRWCARISPRLRPERSADMPPARIQRIGVNL